MWKKGDKVYPVILYNFLTTKIREKREKPKLPVMNTFSGVCNYTPPKLETEEEKRKHFNKLMKRFKVYNSKSVEEREKIKEDAIAYTQNQRAAIYDTWEERKRNRRENYIKHGSFDYYEPYSNYSSSTCGSCIITPPLSDPSHTYVIPDCYYGCGTAPCDCTEAWWELVQLAEKFAKVEEIDGHYFIKGL